MLGARRRRPSSLCTERRSFDSTGTLHNVNIENLDNIKSFRKLEGIGRPPGRGQGAMPCRGIGQPRFEGRARRSILLAGRLLRQNLMSKSAPPECQGPAGVGQGGVVTFDLIFC